MAKNAAPKTSAAKAWAIILLIFAVVPVIVGIFIGLVAELFLLAGVGISALAEWFRERTDEPHERAMWMGVILAGIFLIIVYLFYTGHLHL